MTQPSISATQVNCGQCGSALPVELGAQFVTCEFCGTTSFVDKTRAVFHYALRVTVRQEDALAALRRWMAGNQTVKGLDSQARLQPPAFEYFPMWMVKIFQDGQEQVFLKPAAALSVSELEHIAVPAADLEPYDHALDAHAIVPTVPYETMRQWVNDDHAAPFDQAHGVGDEAVREVSLVHVPIYTCKYDFDQRRYTAIVDAATSKVFANIYPSKWEAPYRAIGAAALAAYFCAALVPMCGYLLGGGAGLAVGMVVYVAAALLLAVPIFITAAVISARV